MAGCALTNMQIRMVLYGPPSWVIGMAIWRPPYIRNLQGMNLHTEHWNSYMPASIDV
jgi:hypothetical protein